MAEAALRKKYGSDREIYTKWYAGDQLMLYFIDPPDKYHQNYVAQLGQAAFVMDD